jgi:hypothetical protein
MTIADVKNNVATTPGACILVGRIGASSHRRRRIVAFCRRFVRTCRGSQRLACATRERVDFEWPPAETPRDFRQAGSRVPSDLLLVADEIVAAKKTTLNSRRRSPLPVICANRRAMAKASMPIRSARTEQYAKRHRLLRGLFADVHRFGLCGASAGSRMGGIEWVQRHLRTDTKEMDTERFVQFYGSMRQGGCLWPLWQCLTGFARSRQPP